MLHIHTLIVISQSRSPLQFMSTIDNVTFHKANASIYFSDRIVYMWAPGSNLVLLISLFLDI